MNTRTLERYQRELGLRPVFIQQLMTDEGVQQPWRVSAVERGSCAVLGFDDDGALIERRARTGAIPVAVGDWALLSRVEQDSAQVERVLERATWLQRGSSHHEGQGQLIAANLDTVFIVAAFAETDKLERRSLRARRLDRFISAVKEGGATPVVVLNKVDLTEREEDELAALRAELTTRLGGVDVLCAAALEHRGLDALAQRCRFSDCGHDTEPGCAVRAAVEAGALPAERLESYRDIERDAQRLRGRQDAYSRHLEHLEQRKFGRMVNRAKELKDKT